MPDLQDVHIQFFNLKGCAAYLVLDLATAFKFGGRENFNLKCNSIKQLLINLQIQSGSHLLKLAFKVCS